MGTIHLKLDEERLERAIEASRLRFMGAKTPFARRFAMDLTVRLRARLAALKAGKRGAT